MTCLIFAVAGVGMIKFNYFGILDKKETIKAVPWSVNNKVRGCPGSFSLVLIAVQWGYAV